MFIDIDYDKRKKGYKINLAKPNQQTIASISEAYGANYSIKLGNINEVTFNVPYFIDKLDERVKNENIELIKEKMYTKISYNNNDEWMVIDSIEDVGSGDEKYMTVTAFTNVYETSNRKINELNLEVVNPEEYYNAVLNDVAWSIGTIDPLFKDIYRSVELSNVTVLEAIITGAETFGAVLDFDTENKKINLIDMDSRAKYRGLNINYSNFLQSINRKRSVDEMTTRLYVYGSEDLSIENVNPTGMRYLEDFTYFLYPFERDENKNVIKSSHYMSDELAHAILDKNELSKEYQPQIKSLQEEIDEETVEYINETTLLNELRFDEMSVSGLLDIAKATGDSKLILQRQGELAEVKTKISIKELTVDHISATIEDLERQISQLQSQISVTSFSKELYDELSMYIIESEFRDDRYIDEEELYRDALKKFDESKSPSVVIEASIDNIIDSLEEDYYSDKVVLGDIARVTDKEMSVEMKSLIVELSFDLDNNTCDVTIANGDIEKDGYDRILSVLYDTQSTTTMLENNKYKWDTVTDVKTEVDLMRDGEIDATRNRIKAGFRESVTIEDRGIILSNPDFPNEIVIMQAGVIALSTDGGENWSTSITPRGVVAETIIGRLVASNNLIVTNDSGSFRIDGEGLTVDMDSIKIMSGEGDTPENIVDSWNEMLITMDEFADDGKLNEYEKNQIARQWNSIAIAHSSMVDAIQNAYGPETPENPYPAEYEIYMESYERLRSYLNDEIQSDGHTILDPLHRGETTDIDSDKYNRLVSDYEVNKDRFQTVIPLEFSQTFIEQTRKEISLNYVQNGEVATKLNLSEEGVRIDGRLLEVNSETHFNDDLVMNAGLIRSADGAINIDLNTGVINLSRPLTINAFPVATEEFVEESLSDAVKDIDVEYGITSDKNTPPSDWNTTPPTWQDGKYIWSRTITVYKNGKTEITEPVNITGATGSSGGIGQAGRSVKSIQEQYYLSTSPLDLENGSWMDEPPEWEPDKYIWTRSVITYENPYGVERTEEISVSGQQGPKGEDAPLVKLSGKTQIIKQDRTGRLTPSSDFTVTGSSMNTTINSWRYSTDGGNFITSPPTGVARSGATITVNPTLVEFNTLTIRASDGQVSDEFTVARAVDGATGEDAYTIILTNESHTFAGNVLHAIPSSTTTDIIAYKGSVRVPVTIDSVSGHPEGIKHQISSNGTINTRITFSVDEKLVEESGTIKLNLVLGGQYITKEFSFAVAYKGERGERGLRGLQGLEGPEGDQGIQGPEGKDGLNSYTHIAYATGDQGQSFNHSTFEQATYIGMYVSHNQNSSGNWRDYKWTLIKGRDGRDGIEGKHGTSGMSSFVHFAYADSADGIVNFSTTDSNREYIGTYTDSAITDYGGGRNLLSNSYDVDHTNEWLYIDNINEGEELTIQLWGEGRVTLYHDDGYNGIGGMHASDGYGKRTITASPRDNKKVLIISNFKGNMKVEKGSTATDWTHAPEDIITDSNDPADYSWTKIKGDKGDRGVSITLVDVEYAQNNSSTSAPTSGWSTNAPAWKNGQYIWSRTKTTYSSGNPTYSKPACITGQKGSEGGEGNDGRGISSIVEQYYLSDSKETRTGGSWTTTAPKWKQGKYMWTRSVINWINPTGVSETTPIVDTSWEAMQEGTKGIGLADKTEILSGTEIYTDEADASAVHVEIDGKSVQEGNNLVANSYLNLTSSGYPIFKLPLTDSISDGERVTIVLKGKLNRTRWGVYNTVGMSELVGLADNERIGEGLWRTSFNWRAVNGNTHLAIFPMPNDDQKNTIEWVKLVRGNATTNEYENPIPTPDYPVEIHGLNDFDVVSSVGKQNILLNSEDEVKNNDYHIENYTPTTPLIEGEEYTATICVTPARGVSSIQLYLSRGYRIQSQIPVSGTSKQIRTSTFTAKYHENRGLEDDISNADIFLYRQPNNDTVTGDTTLHWIKVEKGNRKTLYSPSHEDILENGNHRLIDRINLSLSEPLRSVGDVHDRLFRDDSDGLWKIERNVGVWNISENPPTHADGVYFYMPSLQTNKRDPILSTHFSYYTKSNNEIGFTGAGYLKVHGQGMSGADFRTWARNLNAKAYYPLDSNRVAIETLDQELQYKLNYLRSFQDSNYVYTVINDKNDFISENLRPTLHTTFKGGGWYNSWRAGDDFEKQQKDIESKADSAEVGLIGDRLGNYVLVEGYEDEIGEIDSALKDYKSMIESNEKDTEEAIKDVGTLMTRTNALTENLGELTRSWAFLDTKITMGKEGLLVGEYDFSDPNDPEEPVLTNGILIGTDRIDFISNKVSVAHITGQLMQIDHGIFVETLTVGEHKIETISGGHTIWQWVE